MSQDRFPNGPSRPDLQLLVELSPDAIVIHSEGRIEFINASGAELLGAEEAGQLFGKPILDFIHADYHGLVEERLRTLSLGGEMARSEMKFVRLDGRELFGEVISVPFLYQGKPAAQVVVRDITERRKLEEERKSLLAHEQEARAAAEKALLLQQQIEDRLTLLVEASQLLLGSPQLKEVQPAILALSRKLISADAYAIWRVDHVTRVWGIVAQAGMSPAYEQHSIKDAKNAGELLTQPLIIEDVTKADFLADRQNLYDIEGIKSLLVLPLAIHGVVAGTLTFYYRRDYRFDDTEVRLASALANLAGSAISSSELYEEQRRLRSEGDEAERRAHFLAEASRILASTLDYERTLAQVAQLAVPDLADWCAVDIADPDGASLRLAVAHADPGKVEWANELQRRYPVDINAPQGVPNVLRTGKPELYSEINDAMLVAVAVDEEHLRIMREIGFTSAMVVPLSVQNKTLGAITFVSAESGRRFDESSLIFAEDLARRAAAAIDNARLYRDAEEARRAAEDASRLKDEFLATVSHELRTPLTAVLGWAHMLRAGRLDQQSTQKALETIERNARSQAQLIDDLLDVSRTISGNLRLDVRWIEPSLLIDQAIEALKPAATAKGVRVQKVVDPGLRSITADPARLQQVVWNLLSNAIKFTPAGGQVQIRLTCNDSHTEIAVSDTGQGIDAQFLPHVFDRFRQADQSTTRKHGGLGLGLAIVRHLVELHGGTVRVDSKGAGLGTNFTVNLPLMTVGDESWSSPKSISTDGFSGSETRTRLDGLKVLIVDDEVDTLELLRMMLESWGAEVAAASSVREALLLLERVQPNVLISDIGMPEEDGYVLIRKLRALPVEKGGKIPAVGLTAYASTEDRARVLAAGFQKHLAKPVEAVDLVEVIANLAKNVST
jgi:PAS domain S-box-containing protein